MTWIHRLFPILQVVAGRVSGTCRHGKHQSSCLSVCRRNTESTVNINVVIIRTMHRGSSALSSGSPIFCHIRRHSNHNGRLARFIEWGALATASIHINRDEIVPPETEITLAQDKSDRHCERNMSRLKVTFGEA